MTIHACASAATGSLPINNKLSVCALFFFLFFFSLEMSLFPSIALSFLFSPCMESTLFVFLPGGIFLPCGHGLDFDISLCIYGHTYSKRKYQPGKVAHPARGQLDRKMNISLSPFAPENLVPRDGFGSPVPRQPAHLHTQAESVAYLRDSS